jgi:hypothetical protein
LLSIFFETNNDKVRIEGLIQQGLDEGCEMLVDGRNALIPGFEKGRQRLPFSNPKNK